MMKIFLVSLTTLTISCASIVSDSTYPVTFNSNPPEATIVITDHNGNQLYKGATPTTLTLSAKKGYFSSASYTIEGSLAGYNTGRATLEAGMDGWYIGNALIGGLLGFLIIDPATGAMWKLDDRFVVTLGAKSAAAGSGEQELQIVTIDQIPPAYRDHLIRVN